MSDSEIGKYPQHETIYHMDVSIVPRDIKTDAYKLILEVVLDNDYVSLIKPVSFILD